MTILTDSSSTRQQGITSWQAFIHLLKGYVGPGCLSLPWAISQLGVPLGVIVVFVVSYWTSMNIWHVVELKRVYETSLPPSSRNYPISYPDVGNWLYGKRFARFLTAMICVQQLAVCTVFLSFIGENLGAAIRHSIGDMSHTLVITLVLPAAIGLTCLPNLKVLVPVMTLATLALFAGFAVLSVLVVQQWPDRPQPYPTEIQQWGNVPLAICAVLYSFEGVCLILPIETSMADSKQFAKVFCSAMAASAVIFALVGALCVMAFGPISSGSITAFLLEQAEGGDLEVLYMANTLVSVAVLLTYPLQLFPSYELVGPVMANYFGTRIPEEDDQEYGSVAMHHVGTHNGYVEAVQMMEVPLPLH
jgi:proton-coupled amino acid transporter